MSAAPIEPVATAAAAGDLTEPVHGPRDGLQAPVLAIGDGALGLWRAIRDVWPETKEQRARCIG